MDIEPQRGGEQDGRNERETRRALHDTVPSRRTLTTRRFSGAQLRDPSRRADKPSDTKAGVQSLRLLNPRRPENMQTRRPTVSKPPMRLASVIGLAVTLIASNGASAIVLDFDDLDKGPGAVSHAVGKAYIADGFILSGFAPSYWQDASFRVFGSDHPLWTGSPGLTFSSVSGVVELRRSDFAPFDLYSMDIARGDFNRSLIPVSFIGNRAGGTTAHATYWFKDQTQGVSSTFTFGESFTNLYSVNWHQGAEWHQFDNIHVSAVPEPATAALWAFGMCMVAAHARRRRINHPPPDAVSCSHGRSCAG